MDLEDNGSSSIALVATGALRDLPARNCPPHNLCCDGSGAPFAEAAPAAAHSRSRVCSSGDDMGQGRKGSDKDPGKGSIKAPLLEKKGHRRQISNYSGDGGGSEDSPRHQRQPRHVAEGSRSLLCGPGALLSPWRVQVLLLLQCLILVSTW